MTYIQKCLADMSTLKTKIVECLEQFATVNLIENGILYLVSFNPIWYQSKYDHSQSQETNNPVYRHHKKVCIIPLRWTWPNTWDIIPHFIPDYPSLWSTAALSSSASLTVWESFDSSLRGKVVWRLKVAVAYWGRALKCCKVRLVDHRETVQKKNGQKFNQHTS